MFNQELTLYCAPFLNKIKDYSLEAFMLLLSSADFFQNYFFFKKFTQEHYNLVSNGTWVRSGSSVVECLTRDRGAAGSSLNGVIALSLSKNINPSLVLVQSRKTRSFITERLLMGRRESNKQSFAKLLRRRQKLLL